MATILVLDDDPDIRALLQHLLSQAGYAVLAADSAEAAMKRMAIERPDLIIADIKLPGTSGVDFVAALRNDAALRRIPVVYLTALEEGTELAVRTLGYPLLAKPVQRKDLLALVERQLRRSPKDAVAAVDVKGPAGH
jgi:DNA-binding response OmpR family regulator